MPLFGCIILGLAGKNPLALALGWRPLVFVGEASYCLYLLHFNLWNLIHDSHVLDWTGPDPIRSVDQLRAADRAGAAGAVLGGKAGAATVAEVDGGLAVDRDQGSGIRGQGSVLPCRGGVRGIPPISVAAATTRKAGARAFVSQVSESRPGKPGSGAPSYSVEGGKLSGFEATRSPAGMAGLFAGDGSRLRRFRNRTTGW